jgi:hypothetical protein
MRRQPAHGGSVCRLGEREIAKAMRGAMAAGLTFGILRLAVGRLFH